MIAVTANAACAIALRNAIFKIIPGAYLKPVFDKCKKTAVGNVKSLANKRAEVIKRLTQFGVTEDRILQVIGRKSVDEVTFEDVAVLIGLGTAIKDGDTTVEEAFPDTFKEAQSKKDSKVETEAGSESVNVDIEEPQQNNESQEKQVEEPEYLYSCQQCGHQFDKPKTVGRGANQAPVCPKCKAKNIEANEDKTPAFMED